MPDNPIYPSTSIIKNPFIRLKSAVKLVRKANVVDISDSSIERQLKMLIDEGIIESRTFGIRKFILVRSLDIEKWIKELQKEGI